MVNGEWGGKRPSMSILDGQLMSQACFPRYGSDPLAVGISHNARSTLDELLVRNHRLYHQI